MKKILLLALGVISSVSMYHAQCDEPSGGVSSVLLWWWNINSIGSARGQTLLPHILLICSTPGEMVGTDMKSL